MTTVVVLLALPVGRYFVIKYLTVEQNKCTVLHVIQYK